MKLGSSFLKLRILTQKRAPKKLGESAWKLKIAPKSPRRGPKMPPRAPWQPPRAPRRPPSEAKRSPREPQNALKTTENITRTAKAIIIRKTRRIMKGLKRPYARSYVKYV